MALWKKMAPKKFEIFLYTESFQVPPEKKIPPPPPAPTSPRDGGVGSANYAYAGVVFQ